MAGKGFSVREVGVALTLVAVATGIGISSYRTGLGLAGPQGAQMSPALAAAPVNGATLFAASCAGCHGAQAGGGIGPALAVTRSWSTPEFAAAVLHGQAPEGRELSAAMPRFAETGLSGEPVTEEQLQVIRAFVANP
ncbi:cytochrome c [Deinococcus sp. Arct2-2]|uniref:c-type cytochrome n=1 Tax=Deinococcus sp. Arct2-2 TaxID=2568653 RepID=UPI0010A4A297|nr:cytochrome c [Deinococcus sp. Arct2-2]THF69215.1 cytochrome c [Deinococcus sp. Arct2-2]